MREFLTFFGLLALYHGTITACWLAIAKGSYVGAGVTEAALCLMGFTITQKVANAKTMVARVAYTAGGVTGCLAAMYLK